MRERGTGRREGEGSGCMNRREEGASVVKIFQHSL